MGLRTLPIALALIATVVLAEPELKSANHPDMITNIIRGTDAKTVRPYLVSIQVENRFQYQHVCGGSLLKPNKILSAAHCLKVWGQPGFTYYAKVGYLDIGMGVSDGDGRQTVEIVSMEKHPQYKSNEAGEPYDVVIFTLKNPVELTPGKVELVQLSDTTIPQLLNKIVQLDGWGAMSGEERARPAEKLQHMELKVVDQQQCKDAFKPSWIYGDQHICAISPAPEPKPDSCVGDSGGPLMYEGKQVGIVSFGSPECGINKPSVYASVATFRAFIDSNS